MRSIVDILDLFESMRRSDRIAGLLQSILFEYTEMLTAEQITELSASTFSVPLTEDEVKAQLEVLISAGKVSQRGNKYILTDDCYRKMSDLQPLRVALENESFNRYKQFLKGLNADVNDTEIKGFWTLLNDYIRDAFYQFAANTDAFDNRNLLKTFAAKIEDAATQQFFIQSTIKYVEQLSGDDLAYFEKLGSTLLAFYAPAGTGFDQGRNHWLVFADTDFLTACLELGDKKNVSIFTGLTKLAKDNGVNLNLKYLPITLTECKEQKAFYEKLIPQKVPSTALVNLMLESGKLDSFSKDWYQHYLSTPENTSHPSRIIDSAEKLLRDIYGFEKYNYRFEAVFNEDYINAQFRSYRKFIKDNGPKKRGAAGAARSEDEMQHDVFLREAVKHLRPDNANGYCIASTADALLLEYDASKSGLEQLPAPVFYHPAFLLNRLYQALNADGVEYKKAFVESVLTFSQEDDFELSAAMQEFVSYYHRRGLSDEKLLSTFIADDNFLKEFYPKNDSDRGLFFEVELHNRVNLSGVKADELVGQLNDVLKELADAKGEANANETRIREQENELRAMREKQEFFESELRRLKAEREAAEAAANPIIVAPVVNDSSSYSEEQPAAEEEPILATEQPTVTQKKGMQIPMVIGGVALLIIICLLVFAFKGNKQPEQSTNTELTSASLNEDSIKKAEAINNVPPPASSTNLSVSAVEVDTVAPKPRPVKVDITEAKVKRDLVGKRLAGCGITIKESSEIKNLSNLVFVEKLSSGFMKYKCTAKITQGNDSYTANPYVYYTSDGRFLKVDAANCEQ